MTAKPTHITGRRWFDRRYGNTYHAVTVFFSDGTSKASEIRYGYGDHYLQTAAEMLGIEYRGTADLRENHGITWGVADVARKRDL